MANELERAHRETSTLDPEQIQAKYIEKNGFFVN